MFFATAPASILSLTHFLSSLSHDHFQGELHFLSPLAVRAVVAIKILTVKSIKSVHDIHSLNE